MRAYVCEQLCVFVCLCNRERWLCPAATLRPTTTGTRFWIVRHIHYSTGCEYQRGRRERKMQTASQPPQQALFTLSHNLLALTDYPTSLGPTLVFDSTCFALLPSHSRALALFPSFTAAWESKQFHISIRQRSGGFNIRFDSEHK